MITRAQARSRGLHIYTTGRPCTRAGHTPVHRYVKNGACAACNLENSQRQSASPTLRARRNLLQRRRYARDPALRAKQAQAHRRWKLENPEAIRRMNRAARGVPEPTRPEPTACEICGRTPAQRLQVDHDHTSGKFRGWLCRQCNTALGSLGDSLEALQRAAAYLRRAQ
jgi:Recombination endonuclease VII